MPIETFGAFVFLQIRADAQVSLRLVIFSSAG
jgi:hypothetical protein